MNVRQINMRGAPVRWCWAALAYLCVGLAILGALLPGMPSTVFVLLAAGCASRSSPRLQHWLENHRLFGESLRNWREGGVITRPVKWAASLSMLLALGIVLLTIRHPLLLGAVIAALALGAAVVWSRPEQS